MLQLYRYTHGMLITNFSSMHEVNIVGKLASKYVAKNKVYRRGKYYYEPGTVYTVSNVKTALQRNMLNKVFFTFLKSQYDEVFDMLTSNNLKFETIQMAVPLGIKTNKLKVVGKTMYDYQETFVEYNTSDGTHKLNPLQTGKGKGTILSFTLEKYGRRALIQSKTCYLTKLVKEIIEDTTLDKKDTYLVKSTDDLKKLVIKADNGEVIPDVLFCPTGILRKYQQRWVDGCDDWDIDSIFNPLKLYEVLGVGIRAIDEAHELFDMTYKLDLLTNISKSLYISATFFTERSINPLKYNLQQKLIPAEIRPPEMAPDAYINFVKVPYRLSNDVKIVSRASGSSRGYSHINYEQCLIKFKNQLKEYFDIITQAFIIHFIDNKPKGDVEEDTRCLILFTTREMVNLYTDHLQKVYPKLDIRRFIGGDNETILEEAKVIISTIKSCGAARDIKRLVTVINTVPMMTSQGNKQVQGRLRNPIKIGITTEPTYALLYNLNCTRHNDYVIDTDVMLKPYSKRIWDNDILRCNWNKQLKHKWR